MATLRVRVVSPEKIVYAGEAGGLVAPAWDGMVGILPGHAPMIVLLGMGKLTIERVGGGAEEYHVAGGVLKVEKNEVVILTEYAGREAPVDFPREKLFLPEDYAGPEMASAANSLA
ncbi:MAG: ATP synthase F1 subunit epsilon [Gemmatimonadetes bacterium]|nr:ATP synthase F1 subunit epsilon [Gemmatimonadota bacterium]